MARRSPRQSRPSKKREVVTNVTLESDEAPSVGQTAIRNTARASVVAVRTSPRRPLRAGSKVQASQALQRLTALREQRQSKVTATQPPHARQDTDDSQEADLMDNTATQKLSHVQASDASDECRDVRSMMQSSDSSSNSEKPGPRPAVGRGRKRKAWQESLFSMNAAPVANLPVSRQRQRQQSYQSPVAAHRQNHKLIAGGERRSLSGSDDSDLDDLIASEDDDQVLKQSGKQRSSRSGRKPRSIKEKLNWSDSCSEGSQDIVGAALEMESLQPRAVEPIDRQHAQIGGESVVGEDEDNPQPAKRHRQVSNIIGYDDDWETPAVQAQGSLKEKQHKHTQLPEQLEDTSDESQQPAAGRKRRLSKASSQDNHDIATLPAAKRSRAVVSDSDDRAGTQPRRSHRRHAGGRDRSTEDQPAPPNIPHLLAEEGLDPIEEGAEGTQLAGRRKPSKVGAGSIKDRMRQNQQRLHAGGKQLRKLPAPSFLRNQMYEWHGDRMTAPSDSDSEGSDPPASSDSQHSQSSQDGDGASQHESDLGDFIVDDNPAADDRGPDEEGDVEPGPSATAVSALLEEAGMVSSRTDKEHFTIYIEYLVYDLVDNTFAVRVRGDSRLRKHFDVAVRHVEESLAFKRDSCATSSAWMNAVPGFLDKVDTYPGLSSDLAAKESSMEDLHEGVCQACQRSFTAGHASKRLTLKGKPYKQLWQYGFRRVSDAHVRRDLPYKDNGDDDDEKEQLTGRQELQFAVGRYCCARLQMYHALIHYKHRLRGKLKKHIKHAFNMHQIRKEGADWVKAAKSFLRRQGVIDGLFRQYTALKDLATDYATKVSSSTWRKDQGYIGTEVDRLMYQINSDSEGGEGSDIVPEEHDGSQSDDASGSDNGDTPDMDGVDPRGEHTEAAGVGQHGTETASFPHPDPGKGDTTPLPKPQESSATASQAQDSADSHGDGGEETALEMQALEQTLPYEAGPTSLPSQQTLLYHVASSTQLSDTSHAQQAGSTMVNQMNPQDAQTVPQTAGLHATAAQEHASAQQGVRAVPTAATMVSSPMQGPNLGSPMSPVLGSAKKQKQADIRAFLSPKAMRR